MGKNMRQDSIQLHNGNSGCMNKLLHALNRRHRWQNVRKVLPNKRQGSGKQIIDGGTSEATTNTCQPPDVHHDPKENKPKMEQAVHTTNTEGSSTSSKSSKKFRIRSLISDEMAKRRGKHHRRRRSPSPSRSPRRQTNTVKQLKNDIVGAENEKPPTKVVPESNCESPSTTKKKRKCDICAAMLTVSYLRQKGHSNENRVKENLDGNGQPAAALELQVSDGHDTHYLHSHMPLHSRKQLTKSFSIPIRLGSSKRRDFEVEELKNRLKICKDIQTAKENFILPMNQLRDIGLPKPMLTRPESFRTSSTTSKKDKKQTSINSKTLKQKIGFTIKDSKKEKRRILMDAVFHKIPYGRRSSKDPKKMSPDKLKSNSTSSSGSDRSSVEKSHLKKTSSTSEVMSKYRRLLSQTSTREEKMQLSDHRTKLFVAGGEQSFGSSGKTHKRIRSLPNISPSDFTHSQEFPVKPAMDIHLSISGALFDDQKSLDPFVYGERLNVYTAAKKGVGKNTKLFEKGMVVDENHGTTSNLQEKSDRNEFSAATERAAKETKLADKYESNDENIGADENPPDHEEIIHDQKESRVDSGNTFKETILADKDEAIDQNLEMSTDTSKSDHRGEPRVTIEVEKDKNFNDILGMFKKASDERTKLNQETDSIVAARKVAKKDLEIGQKTLDNQERFKSDLRPTDSEDNKDEGVNRNLEDCNITLDRQENDNSLLGSSDEVEIQTHEYFQVQTSFVKDIRNSPVIKDFSDENKQHGFSTSISRPSSIAKKRPNNTKINARNGYMMEDGFLHLDIDEFKDNPEFQFVKEVLERSGFLENQFLGEWYSNYQPIDPLLFEEVETTFLQSKILEDLDSMKDEEATQKIINDHHLLLFDIINEALLHLQSKTFTYCPHPLTYRSKVRPMPVGRRVLEEVWNIVTMYLSWKPEQLQPSLDDVLSRDLDKGDGWMNLQTDSEFVGIELEEMLADDLLDELVFDDLLM